MYGAIKLTLIPIGRASPVTGLLSPIPIHRGFIGDPLGLVPPTKPQLL